MFNIIFIPFYTIITFFTFDFNKKRFRFLKFIPILLLSFIIGLQKNVGIDYNSYINIFNNIEHIKGIEIGSLLLIRLSKWIFNSYHLMFLLFSFFSVIFLFKYLNYYSKFKSLSVYIFLSLTYLYPMAYSGIRQILAVMIVAFGTKYIMEKAPFKYLLYIFIAMLFHKSAIIMLPFYFLAQFNYSVFFMLTTFFSSLLALKLNLIVVLYDNIFLSDLFLKFFNEYYYILISVNKQNKISVMVIFYFIILCLILTVLKNTKNDKKIEFLTKMFYFELVLFVLLQPFPGLRRIIWYFEIFKICLIPNIILKIKGKYQKGVFIMLIAIISFFVLINRVNTIPEMNYNSIIF